MEEELKTIQTVDTSPFKHLVMTLGELPTSFVDSMTYYECLAWLVNFIQNTVIPTVNNNAEAVEELQTAFTTLKNYVDHYFDNLDVQNEINNKIDEMVEEGTLQRILNSPATTENLGGVIVKNGLQIDSDGNLSVKAGNGIKVNSDGVGILPLYIDGLEVIKYNYVDNNESTNTQIKYVIIPAGNKPKMVMSDPDNPNVGATASEIDYKYKPTVMSNLFAWDTSDHTTYGPLIIDGVIKVENNLGSGTYWNRPIIGLDSDGRLHCINGSTPANEVNMQYACRAWTCIYNDGSINPDITNTKEPRTFLAQDYNGNYLIGVCGGRQADDTGMGLTDILNFVRTEINFNAKLIFNLDGGGSSNLLFHGIRQNKLVDREDRVCPNWLVWSTDTTIDDGIYKSQSINNQNNIRQEIDNDGHIINQPGMIEAGMAGSDRISIASSSRIMKVNPRVVIYNVTFNITGEGNISSYADLLKNLPKTDANYYFLALKHSGYTTVPVYITSMADDTTKSRIRSLQAMEPGTYSIHFAVQCNTQY